MLLDKLSYKLSRVFPKQIKQFFNKLGINGSMFRDGRRDIPGLKHIGATDIFLCSYPKSGNTWLRMVIAYLMDGHTDVDYSLKTIENKIPEVGNTLFESSRGYVVKKSHYPYFDLYPKMIYVYRDPRDVAISFYHYRKKFYNADTEFKDSIKTHESVYGSWKNHIQGALAYSEKNNQNCLLLKYEDMLLDPHVAVKKAANFIGVEVSETLIDAIVTKTSFEKLKKSEKNHGSILKKASGFFRSGTKEQWRNDLEPEQLEFLNNKYADELKQLNYPLD